MKFRQKFFWKCSFFDQNQQPLKGVEPFQRILRALFISQCPHKFPSFLDLRNASNRFRLFSRDFRLFRFFFPGSACFSSLAFPRNLPSWVKYHGRFESSGKEFRWTKFIAVERVRLFCGCWHGVFNNYSSCGRGGLRVTPHKDPYAQKRLLHTHNGLGSKAESRESMGIFGVHTYAKKWPTYPKKTYRPRKDKHTKWNCDTKSHL